MVNRFQIILSCIVLYIASAIYSLYQSASPMHPCDDPQSLNSNIHSNVFIETSCLTPLLSPKDVLILDLWIFAEMQHSPTQLFQWQKVDSCSSFPIQLNQTMIRIGGDNCTISLPSSARMRGTISNRNKNKGKVNRQPLKAKWVFQKLHHESNDKEETIVVSEIPFELTQMIEMMDPIATIASDSKSSKSSKSKTLSLVPHYKYSKQPIVVRLVAEYRHYGSPHRSDGIVLKRHLIQNRFHSNLYKPLSYVDDNGLLYKSSILLAPPYESIQQINSTSIPPDDLLHLKIKPPVQLSIKISIITPERDVIHRIITEALEVAKSFLHPSELDEIKYFIRDEHIYRFLLTQWISMVHVYLDYMAFRDEIQFYKGKSSMAGVSISSILINLLCSIIIFLYLLDGSGTSAIVLFSIAGEIGVQGWKVFKIIRPTVHLHSNFPFIQILWNSSLKTHHHTIHNNQHEHSEHNSNQKQIHNTYILEIESKTKEYDQIATTYMSLLLYPIIIGMGLYALKFYTYKSYYSWAISNLADAVYTFGFIALCPQIYINYRLKSVAHLPWKVFLYKIFNTFIDDVFALLISMPWKHRWMTLRDDVIFVIFLCQAYLYRVDKARPNEYGYVYETNVDEDGEQTKKKVESPKPKSGETKNDTGVAMESSRHKYEEHDKVKLQ